MELLKLLLNFTLMLMTSPRENFAAINFRPPDDVVPKNYRIQLEVDIENNIFHGKSKVSIIIYKETDTIYLHAVQLNISQPTTIENKTTMYIVHNITYLPKWGAVVLSFDHKLSPGNYTLNMAFMGNISNNVDGFFKTSYINDEGDIEWFVATHNWATGIRRTFPCWDDPKLKARFNIIVQHRRSYTVLSTVTRSMKNVYVTDDVVQTHFVETPEIPTYFIAIVLCKLPNIIELLGYVNLRSKQQFVHDLIFASYVIKNVTRYFQDEWKEVIVLPMPEHFAVPGLLNNGIATWGPVFYRDEDIIYDEKLDPIGRKMEIAYLIGREVGRRCLSSMRSPSWWSYFWLSEGIATVLFAWDIIDEITVSNSPMSDLFVIRIVQESLYLDDQGIMYPLASEYNIVSDINSVFSFSYYIKAPAILRMLRHILGIRVFRKGIDMYLDYLERHIRNTSISYIEKPASALTDFLIAMQVAYDERPTIISQEINVTEVMHPWIRQNHYPIVHVTRYIQNHFHIKIENASKTWWFPVTYTMPSWHASRPILHKSGMEMSIFGRTLEEDWIILNLHQTGYYRVNYDTEIWRKIAYYLNYGNYTNIPVLNRAQIIDDAFYFTITGQLNASIFWELTRYLSRETEYVAWYPMIKAIERISYIFPFQNRNKYFKTIISLDQLEPLLGTIGYNEDPNDSDFIKCLRQEAVKWACVLNLPNCKKMAFNKLQWHLTNPTRNTLLPGWKKWTYCNGLKVADIKIYKNILSKALFQEDRISLEFLTCSEEYYIYYITIKVENRTEYPFNVIEEDISDSINFFYYNIAKHAKSNSVFNLILANLEKIKPQEISMAAALIDIINHVYFKEQLDKVMEFVRKIKIKSLIEFTGCYEYLRQMHSEFTKTCEFILNDKKIISYTKKKIDIRLSQIKNQLNSFFSVFGISPGRKIEDCNA